MENVEKKGKKKMSIVKKAMIGLGITGVGIGLFLARRRYGVEGGMDTLKSDLKKVGGAVKKPFAKKADAQVNEGILMEETPQVIEQPQQLQQQPQYNSGNRNTTSWSSGRREFYNNNKR